MVFEETGTYVVSLVVEDEDGAATYPTAGSTGGYATVTVIADPPNMPPVAVCQDVTVDAGSNCTAQASINNGSFDPDGDPITLTQDPAGPYPFGNTTVTQTVTDESGASDSCEAMVTVVDVTPPEITINLMISGAGDDDDDERYLITNFGAIDNCDPGPVTAALIDIGCEEIPVTDGQMVSLECGEDDCEVEYEDGILEIETRTAVLVVTSTDASGNTVTSRQALCPAGGDDD